MKKEYILLSLCGQSNLKDLQICKPNLLESGIKSGFDSTHEFSINFILCTTYQLPQLTRAFNNRCMPIIILSAVNEYKIFIKKSLYTRSFLSSWKNKTINTKSYLPHGINSCIHGRRKQLYIWQSLNSVNTTRNFHSVPTGYQGTSSARLRKIFTSYQIKVSVLFL